MSITDRSKTISRAVVDVATEAQAPVRRLHVRVSRNAVAARAVAGLEPGLYRLSLSVSDAAGNTGVSPVAFVLLNYPVRSRVVSRFLGVGRRVALTFDDCNSGGAWNSILSTLRRYDAKATFFCPGSQVLAHTRAALRTLRLGQTIGDHSWNHPDFTSCSYRCARGQFLRDRTAWWRLAKVTPVPFFRPPYGSFDREALAAAGSAGYRWTVLWDVDTRDWTQPGSSTIAARVLRETRPGSIVLMHVLPQTAAALPTILRRLRARRYKALPLDALFLVRGARPIAGGWR